MGREMATTQHFADWVCGPELFNEYLMYAFMAAGPSLIRSGEGTTVRTIYFPALKAMQVALPPLEEQKLLASRVARLLRWAARLGDTAEAALCRMAPLNQSILAKAFRGELVPQDPNDEPASVLLERIRAEREAAEPKKKKRRKKAEPKPPPEPEPEPEPPPGPTTDFLTLDSQDQLVEVYYTLIGQGPLSTDDAIRHAADKLRDQGKVQFKRLRSGGQLYEAINGALKRAVRNGYFDRPRRGMVRAILTDAKDYERDDWRRCLLAVLDSDAVDRDDALRAAADWAAENMDLEFNRLRSDGVIMKGLKSALNSAIRRGEVERVDVKRIRRGSR